MLCAYFRFEADDDDDGGDDVSDDVEYSISNLVFMNKLFIYICCQ